MIITGHDPLLLARLTTDHNPPAQESERLTDRFDEFHRRQIPLC